MLVAPNQRLLDDLSNILDFLAHVFLEIAIDEAIYLLFRVISQFRTSMTIKNADCIGIQSFQLIVYDAVLTRSISFILHTLDSIGHNIFLEMERR